MSYHKVCSIMIQKKKKRKKKNVLETTVTWQLEGKIDILAVWSLDITSPPPHPLCLKKALPHCLAFALLPDLASSLWRQPRASRTATLVVRISPDTLIKSVAPTDRQSATCESAAFRQRVLCVT